MIIPALSVTTAKKNSGSKIMKLVQLVLVSGLKASCFAPALHHKSKYHKTVNYEDLNSDLKAC